MDETTALIKGLKELNSAIALFKKTGGSELRELETAWLQLRAVYHGRAASQFKARWRRTDEWWEECLARLERLEKELEQRRQQLERFDDPAGI